MDAERADRHLSRSTRRSRQTETGCQRGPPEGPGQPEPRCRRGPPRKPRPPETGCQRSPPEGSGQSEERCHRSPKSWAIRRAASAARPRGLGQLRRAVGAGHARLGQRGAGLSSPAGEHLGRPVIVPLRGGWRTSEAPARPRLARPGPGRGTWNRPRGEAGTRQWECWGERLRNLAPHYSDRAQHQRQQHPQGGRDGEFPVLAGGHMRMSQWVGGVVQIDPRRDPVQRLDLFAEH
jgi:hypothetical protein